MRTPFNKFNIPFIKEIQVQKLKGKYSTSNKGQTLKIILFLAVCKLS